MQVPSILGPKKTQHAPQLNPWRHRIALVFPPLLEPILGPEKPNIVPLFIRLKASKRNIMQISLHCVSFLDGLKTYNYCMYDRILLSG